MEAVGSRQADQKGIGGAPKFVLGALTAIGVIALDFCLPSLPAIAIALSAGAAETQLTISVFLVTYGLGQIIWGPLSDRFGRRWALIAGLVLFVIGSWGSAAAWSIESMVAWRLLQGVGACCAPVVARAMVRDSYHGEEASRVLAFQAIILGLTPVVAPVAGALVAQFLGWRIPFVVMGLVAIGLIFAVVLVLRETHEPSARGMSLVRQWMSAYRLHLGNRRLLYFTAIISMSSSGIFCFVSGSSFVFITVLGASPVEYGMSFAIGAAGYAIGAWLLMRSKSAHSVSLRRGTVLWGLAGLGLGILGTIDLSPGLGSIVLVALLLMLFMCGSGLVLPTAMGTALSSAQRDLGAASGLMGVCQYVVASAAGILTGYLGEGSHVGMCFGMAGSAAIGLLLLAARPRVFRAG